MANTISPLGAIDLVSAAITFVAMIPLYLAREKHDIVKILAASCKCVGISLWVAWLLDVTFGVPFAATWYWIAIGDLIAVVGIGYPLYRAVKKVKGSL